MLQISVWKVGPYWQVQVFDKCHCDCGCEPDYLFNEQVDNELDLQRAWKQALVKFNAAEEAKYAAT